jgi:hypothetical protein
VQDAVSVGGEQVDDFPKLVATWRPMMSDGSPRIADSASMSSSSRASVGMPPGRSRTGLFVVYAPQAHFHRHSAPP